MPLPTHYIVYTPALTIMFAGTEAECKARREEVGQPEDEDFAVVDHYKFLDTIAHCWIPRTTPQSPAVSLRGIPALDQPVQDG